MVRRRSTATGREHRDVAAPGAHARHERRRRGVRRWISLRRPEYWARLGPHDPPGDHLLPPRSAPDRRSAEYLRAATAAALMTMSADAIMQAIPAFLMGTAASVLVLALYTIGVAIVMVYTVGQFHLLYFYFKGRSAERTRSLPVLADEAWPFVTCLLY